MDGSRISTIALSLTGALLVAIFLADVFLTVLYARIGSGFLSHRLACIMWALFRCLTRRLHRFRNRALSICGPTIVVCIIFIWAVGLMTGVALIAWPAVGKSIVPTIGTADTTFSTAFYVAGGSFATAGSGEYAPRAPFYRLLLVFDSFIGISVLTLSLTYVIEIYNALQRRNSFALKLHLLSAETGDAAELLGGLGPDGHFDAGYIQLTDMGVEMINLKESHHFYSALFYFRFRDPHYAVSRIALLSLDTVTLIKSALDDDEYGWLKKSAATEQLWRASMQLLTVVARSFLPGGLDQGPDELDDEKRRLWSGHYHAAVDKLHQAGIKTFADEIKGFEIYASLRIRWDRYIRAFARHMEHDLDVIDRATVRPNELREAEFNQRMRISG